jgi:hypothetical protein
MASVVAQYVSFKYAQDSRFYECVGTVGSFDQLSWRKLRIMDAALYMRLDFCTPGYVVGVVSLVALLGTFCTPRRPARPCVDLLVSSWTTLLPYGSPRGLWVCTNIWLVQVCHIYSFDCVEALDAGGVREAIIRPNRSLLAILMNYSKSDYRIDYSSC